MSATGDLMANVETVATACCSVFGAAEAFTRRSFPLPLRAATEALAVACAEMDAINLAWSTPADRLRIARELGSARTDLLEALGELADASRGPARDDARRRIVPLTGSLIRSLYAVEAVLRIVDLTLVDRALVQRVAA